MHVYIKVGSRFVLQNGGFISTRTSEDADGADAAGWEDESEISRETKKKFGIWEWFSEMILMSMITLDSQIIPGDYYDYSLNPT